MSINFVIDRNPALASLNFSNANAVAMLRLAGLPVEDIGEVSGAQLASAARRLMLAVNSARARRAEVEPLSRCGNLIECGRSDEYIERRSAELLALFVEAQQLGCGVYWG